MIPVIDCQEGILHQRGPIFEALTEVGFVFLINHGIEEKLVCFEQDQAILRAVAVIFGYRKGHFRDGTEFSKSRNAILCFKNKLIVQFFSNISFSNASIDFSFRLMTFSKPPTPFFIYQNQLNSNMPARRLTKRKILVMLG